MVKSGKKKIIEKVNSQEKKRKTVKLFVRGNRFKRRTFSTEASG